MKMWLHYSWPPGWEWTPHCWRSFSVSDALHSPGWKTGAVCLGWWAVLFFAELPIFKWSWEPAECLCRLLGHLLLTHLLWCLQEPGFLGVSLQGLSEDMSWAVFAFVSDGLGPPFSGTSTHVCKLTHNPPLPVSPCTSLKVIIIYYVWGNAAIARDNHD